VYFLACGKTVNKAETEASKRWRNKMTYNLLYVSYTNDYDNLQDKFLFML